MLVLKQTSLEYFCWQQKPGVMTFKQVLEVGSISKHHINLLKVGSSGQGPGGHLLGSCLGM